MAIVDPHVLPLSVSTYCSEPPCVCLLQLGFDFYMIEATPYKLVVDRAYHSDPLEEPWQQQHIDMIAMHRKNRKGKRPGRSSRSTLSMSLERGAVHCVDSVATSYIRWEHVDSSLRDRPLIVQLRDNTVKFFVDYGKATC